MVNRFSNDMIPELEDGVSIRWLANVFRLSEDKVRKRLAAVTPVRVDKNQKFYLIDVAAAYLVTPKMKVEEFMRGAKTTDLPPALQKDVWRAALDMQKFNVNAKKLYHVNDLVSILSELFLMLKAEIQLWADAVERSVGLTPEQREKVIELSDLLQTNFYNKLLEMKDNHETLSSVKDVIEIAKEDPNNYAILRMVSEGTEDAVDETLRDLGL